MAIVSGMNIPDNKRVEVSLQHVYGIGQYQAKDVLDKAGVDENPRVKDLTETQLIRAELTDTILPEGFEE